MLLLRNTPVFTDAQEATDCGEAIGTLLLRSVRRTVKPCDSGRGGFFAVNRALYCPSLKYCTFPVAQIVLPATGSYDLTVLFSLVRMKLSQLTVA